MGALTRLAEHVFGAGWALAEADFRRPGLATPGQKDDGEDAYSDQEKENGRNPAPNVAHRKKCDRKGADTAGRDQQRENRISASSATAVTLGIADRSPYSSWRRDAERAAMTRKHSDRHAARIP